MADEPAAPGLGEIVEDRLLDGRLVLRQPKKGHRAGTDAILLAAALPMLEQGPLLDIGAGVGTVGLAAALAQPGLRVTLLERDPDIAALAEGNVLANRLGDRVDVVASDVTAPAAILEAAGLASGRFACVAMNPPFHGQGDTRVSPLRQRREAHVAEGPLTAWLKAARRLLRPGGTLVVIHRADALPLVLEGLGVGFGGIVMLPVQTLPDRPAIRILVSAVLNSRKPAALLPAFVLHRPEGGFTASSEAVHRGIARLSMSAG